MHYHTKSSQQVRQQVLVSPFTCEDTEGPQHCVMCASSSPRLVSVRALSGPGGESYTGEGAGAALHWQCPALVEGMPNALPASKIPWGREGRVCIPALCFLKLLLQ